MAGDSGCTPALASPQEPPTMGLADASQISGLHPPTRSVEPWTEEVWFYLFQQPSQADNQKTGGLFGSGYGVYRGGYWTHPAAGGAAEAGYDWLPRPMDIGPIGTATLQFNWLRHGSNIHWTPYSYERTLVSAMGLTVCPRYATSPECMPMDQPVLPNDTCRQATVWPAWSGENAARHEPDDIAFKLQNDTSVSDAEACPHSPGPASAADDRSYPRDDRALHQYSMTAFAMNSGYPMLPSGESQQSQIVHRRWHQAITVTYPPGTVAELPLAMLGSWRKDDPRLDYPWRVNPMHVQQVAIDGAAPGDIRCYTKPAANQFVPGQPRVRATMVLLDNPDCISSRSCKSDGFKPPKGAYPNSTAYQAAAYHWIRHQLTLPAHDRSVRIGCSPTYTLNTSEWNVDLTHFDYPAGSSSRAATVGGMGFSVSPARRGRWNGSSPAQYQYVDNVICPLTDVPDPSRRELMPPASVPWRLPFDVSPVIGPIARYRGNALARAVPSVALNRSLPSIVGGYWECGQASETGGFVGRPLCRMVCRDPSQVPVDLALEAWVESQSNTSDGHSSVDAEGWRMSASLARIWWSFWTGTPALQQPEVDQVGFGSDLPPFAKGLFADRRRPVQPPSYLNPGGASGAGMPDLPAIQCMQDGPAGVSKWLRAWNAWPRFAEREPAGIALVSFTLAFDRNYYPASVSVDETVTVGPGLSFPMPTAAQLQYMMHEVESDVRDLTGEWRQHPNSSTSFDRVVRVDIQDLRSILPTDSPYDQTLSGDCLRTDDVATSPPKLAMEIDIVVELEPLRPTNKDQRVSNYNPSVARSRSSGAVARQLQQHLLAGVPAGVWLPAARLDSIDVRVMLPCLAGGVASSPAACGSRVTNGASLAAIMCLAIATVAVLTAAAYTCWCEPTERKTGSTSGHQMLLAADRTRSLTYGGRGNGNRAEDTWKTSIQFRAVGVLGLFKQVALVVCIVALSRARLGLPAVLLSVTVLVLFLYRMTLVVGRRDVALSSIPQVAKTTAGPAERSMGSTAVPVAPEGAGIQMVDLAMLEGPTLPESAGYLPDTPRVALEEPGPARPCRHQGNAALGKLLASSEEDRREGVTVRKQAWEGGASNAYTAGRSIRGHGMGVGMEEWSVAGMGSSKGMHQQARHSATDTSGTDITGTTEQGRVGIIPSERENDVVADYTAERDDRQDEAGAPPMHSGEEWASSPEPELPLSEVEQPSRLARSQRFSGLASLGRYDLNSRSSFTDDAHASAQAGSRDFGSDGPWASLESVVAMRSDEWRARAQWSPAAVNASIALALIDWDAQGVIWQGGRTGRDTRADWVRALQQYSWLPRGFEAIVILVTVAWSVVCAVGACPWEACDVSGAHSVGPRRAPYRLFVLERVAVLGAPLLLALVGVLAAACSHALFWRHK